MCLTNIFINLDHGILPAATDEIKIDLGIKDAELGLLGSFVYFGIIAAGFFAGKLYLKYETKIVVLISILLMVLVLFTFT
jgi:MFS family permease